MLYQTHDLSLTIDAASLSAVGPVAVALTRDTVVGLDGALLVGVVAKGSLNAVTALVPSTSTTLSGDIAAPVDEVFALLVDPRRIPDWLPGCYGVGGSPMVYKGARLLVRFGRRTTTLEITDFIPPTSLGWAEHGTRAGSKTFFKLGFAGATTAIKMMHVSTFSSVRAWLRAKLKNRRDPYRQLDQTLQNLRKLTTA